MNQLLLAAVAGALAAAVLIWPGLSRSRSTRAAASLLAAGGGPAARDGGRTRDTGSSRLAGVWREDPVVLWRRWRVRHRPADLEAAALVLLDASVPALQAGLTPLAALRLAGSSTPGAQSPELRRFVGELESAHSRGAPSSQAWVELATRSGSVGLGFVAGAWRLSESTGAPLAVAALRAAVGLRDLQSRRRRVAVAVAGPRATVFVLTVLPLTGPLFGVVCGISPVELYLGSALSMASLALGLALAALGRWWCRRLIRSAVGP